MMTIRLCPLSLAVLAAAACVTLQGATVTNLAVADTTLFEHSPNNNLGRSTLASGAISDGGAGMRARALLKFDLSTLPANAVVTNARLVLRVTKAPSGAVASTFGLRRVLRDWGEGTKGSSGAGQGAAAAAGEATWTSRFTGQVGGTWSAPGGTSPVDFLGTSSATANVSGLGFYTFGSTAALVADVQSWKAEPSLNFGWILISQSEGSPRTARRFGNREGAPVQVPQLIIDYALPATVAPSISSAPASQTVNAGDTVTFSVGASGTQPFSYQWRFNDVDLPGQTADILTLTGVTTNQQGNYSVLVSNSAGSATGGPATLTVVIPATKPTITQRPADQVLLAGDTLSLSVTASGTEPFTYTWRHNGTNLPAFTGPSLTIPNAQVEDGGGYTVEVGNPAGSDVSPTALVSILAAVRVEGIATLGPVATLTFLVPMGQNYAVQRSATLAIDGWLTFTNITAKFAPVQAVVSDSALEPVRFYRLLATPVD